MKGYSILYGLLALVSIGAATAVAHSGPDLAQRLDSITGAGVRENRSVSSGSLRVMQLMRNPTVTRDDVYKVINRYPFRSV